MTAFIARFLRDVTAPVGRTLFRAVIALALVIVALGAMTSALVVANFWLYAWLTTMMTPLQSLGVVIGAWVAVALLALLAAWIVLRRSRAAPARPVKPDEKPRPPETSTGIPADQIDAMVDPLAKTLGAMGMQRETVALLAGAQAFKTLKTTQLCALALIVGYAVARSAARKD